MRNRWLFFMTLCCLAFSANACGTDGRWNVPWPGLGCVTCEGKAFEWHPQRVSTSY